MRTFPTGTPPASQICAPCSGCPTPCSANHTCSWALPYLYRRAATSPGNSPRTPPCPTPLAALSTRQYASAFNQPLSFDTSEVTTMWGMFFVRSALGLCPTCARTVPCLHQRHRHRALPPLDSATRGPHTSPRTARRPLLTRQGAVSFNQPLSFNTSKVTSMWGMFGVCAPSACAAADALPPLPPCTPRPQHTLYGCASTPFRLGSLRPCPMRTSSSSVARGRAPRPLPLLAATTQIGGREAAWRLR